MNSFADFYSWFRLGLVGLGAYFVLRGGKYDSSIICKSDLDDLVSFGPFKNSKATGMKTSKNSRKFTFH